MAPIRVALVDDHPIVLAGIVALLTSLPDIELVGQATTGSQALALTLAARPDVVVIDLSLPDMAGVELARRITAALPTAKLLALTVHEDRAYVQPMLEAGARGYLLKRSAAEDLLRAIRAVAEGGIYLDPTVAGTVLPSGNRPSTFDVDTAVLSPREEAVLRSAALGHSNKEIARTLDLSVKTIETYKARASEKLSLRSRAEIVRFGAARGWLAPGSFPTT